jgi:osmoprotectant transport system permease protein
LLLMPLVTFRANRIVQGVGMGLFSATGAAMGGLLVGLLVFGALVAFAPVGWRASAVLSTAIVSLGALLFAVGGAVLRLMPAGDTAVRVSVGSGAWVALAGVSIAWFQGAREVPRRRAKWMAVAAASAFVVLAGVFGGLSNLSLAIEYRNQDAFWTLVGGHIAQSVAGMGIGAFIGVPLGIAAARNRVIRSAAIPVVSVVQTVPSLALFGLLMVPLTALNLPSIGTLPALIALTLYALLPIVRNTYLGIAGVDPAIVDAGLGMGMSRSRLLWRVEMPLALPLIFEGLRSALVLTVGIAAVMAIVGARNLGTLVFLGFGSQADDLVLLGALPMVVLAIIADQSVRALEAALVSPGIRGGRTG